jgi:hypothetical protein
MTTNRLRVLTMLTPDDLHLLRLSPYESPTVAITRGKLYRRAMSLVQRGLMEHDDERVQFRCTDEGAELAAPLTPAEAKRHVSSIRKSRGDRREALLVRLLARVCAEVAIADSGLALPRFDEVVEIVATAAARVG